MEDIKNILIFNYTNAVIYLTLIVKLKIIQQKSLRDILFNISAFDHQKKNLKLRCDKKGSIIHSLILKSEHY